jgi:hypothetical protein
MAILRWKSLSHLDDCERTFLERIRSPDPNFPFLLKTLAFVLPLSFAFLAILFAAFTFLTEALLGPQTSVTQGINAVSLFVLKLIPFAILITFVAMYALRGYVNIKLRRQRTSPVTGNVRSDDESQAR